MVGTTEEIRLRAACVPPEKTSFPRGYCCGDLAEISRASAMARDWEGEPAAGEKRRPGHRWEWSVRGGDVDGADLEARRTIGFLCSQNLRARPIERPPAWLPCSR